MRIQRESLPVALLLLALSLILVLPLGGCKDKTETDPIRFGGVYSLTGKTASFGEWVKKGVDLAVDQVNAQGGINGRKLEVLVEDTQADPKNAVSALQKLITVNRIPVVIGFITSSEALACAPIAERNKVLMITPIASAEDLRKAGDFIFRTRESGSLQSHRIAEYMYSDQGIKDAAVLCENAANAIGYRDAFVEKYKALGGKIILNELYDEGQTDFRNVLTKVKDKQATAVYAPGVGKIVGRILKQAAEMNIKPRFFSSAGLEDPEVFKVAGDAANGVVYGSPDFSEKSKRQATKHFFAEYKKRYNENPSVYSANAYDAVMLVVEAFRSANTKPEDIRDFLYGIKSYPGASGEITFDKDGEVSKPIILKRTVHGDFEDLGK
jgi:branched-chain amino acid transport system substrate-binding protein